MTYTVSKLISNAFYVSGILSREYQELQGSQLQDGLDALNAVLSDKMVEEGMIPYYSTYRLSSLTGVEKYFIPNLINIASIVFFINTVRYEMMPVPRHQYFGTTRADNIKSLPLSYHVERVAGGCDLYIYFLPNQNYLLNIIGLFTLQIANINQDLQAKSNVLALGALLYIDTNTAFTLGAGQFVINNYDMANLYHSINELVVAINEPNTTGVTALFQMGNFTLLSDATIVLSTNGVSPSPLATINFQNFNIIDFQTKENTYFLTQFDLYYINYLKYAVSQRLCVDYGVAIPEAVNSQLNEYQGWINKSTQQLDLRNVKISTLGSAVTINYAQINFGKGWFPG